MLQTEEDERGVTINAMYGYEWNPRSKTVSISAIKDIWETIGKFRILLDKG